jgi:predicted XRE-type DNA-binding protein
MCFRGLGFGPKEAESLRLRAELMVELKRLIQSHKLTQSSAANLFGVTQPRVSDLVRGSIDLFSIEALVNMCGSASLPAAWTACRDPNGPGKFAPRETKVLGVVSVKFVFPFRCLNFRMTILGIFRALRLPKKDISKKNQLSQDHTSPSAYCLNAQDA